ncbi:MAG TPA: hypothetical protein VGW31_15290 [Hanamia sp.]|nr:hypothetical protein [Hanamia sp.]
MKLFLILLFAIFCSPHVSAQFKIKDSCVSFTLNIEAKNLESDSIKLTIF